MSATEIEEILDMELGNEVPHVACCVLDRFFCGRQFHPEAAAEAGSEREECCPTCVEISDETWCPPLNPTHCHCPIPGPTLGGICPPRKT